MELSLGCPSLYNGQNFCKLGGWREKFSFYITHGHVFAFCPEKVARYFQKALYYTTDISLPFFKYRRRKKCPRFRKSGDIMICGY